MKIWVDDVRPAPDGYRWCKSVNETIRLIEAAEKCIERQMNLGHEKFLNHNFAGRSICYNHANYVDIELIDLDHDSGDYHQDGGDYIRILDYLEMTGRNYPIRLHTANPVGRENMTRIVRKNGWKLVH